MSEHATGQHIYVGLPDTLLPTRLPGGWSMDTSEPVTVTAPDRDIRMTFLVFPAEVSMAELVVSAWQQVTPTFSLPLVQEGQAPPGEGWTGAYQAVYQGAADNEAMALAFVRTFGDRAI